MVFARNSLPELVFFLKSAENLIIDGYDSLSYFQQNSRLEIDLLSLFLNNFNLMNAFCPQEVRLCNKSFWGVAPKINFDHTQHLKFCPLPLKEKSHQLPLSPALVGNCNKKSFFVSQAVE